ncbi:hypothetical protein INT45_006511 [Circinella minor]|uniref:Caffeoyl-CoA O-methyltransferase n=1 Tax=Circinella minor TaxID=1195481 RepID=A0A8H7S3V0_9FUNG|nr:hypothetical protein INT45_006511 [Circinella minor]
MGYNYNNIIDVFPGNIDNRLRTKEEEYTNNYSTPFPPEVAKVLETLIDETIHEFEEHYYMTTETERKLLFQLIKIFRCSHVLEIGTFTGVATIAMASALSSCSSLSSSGENNGDNSSSRGKVITLEMDPKAMSIAQKHAKKLKYLNDRIDFVLGPAMESLVRITKEQPNKQYDLIFIDANKDGYTSYFDFIMDNHLLSDNGLIIADNALYYGQVHRQAGYDDIKLFNSRPDIPGHAKNIHEFNQHVLKDKRVQVVILPLFDGISIITKSK